MNKRRIGGCYEEMAADYLKKQGVEILATNYRCKIGEIDIVAKDGNVLVFAEVKYRKTSRNGDPAEAVGYQKRKKISRVAVHYLVTHYSHLEISCRFDVLSMNETEIRWIKNAFDYTQ